MPEQRLGTSTATDVLVADNKPLRALLEQLSSMAMAQMHNMDGRGIPSVLWALAVFKLNPLGQSGRSKQEPHSAYVLDRM
jgi:hypothetical protein